MSFVAFFLNVLLASLLLMAVIVGVRLERRLKALREGHTRFVTAVTELNDAVARADRGLAELRNAATEAQTTLMDGLHDARAAHGKLATQIAAATEAEDKLAKAVARAAAMPPPRPAAAPAASAEAVLDLTRPIGRPAYGDARRDPAVSRAGLAQPAPASAADPRSRARVDDDLFAPEPAFRLAAGARR